MDFEEEGMTLNLKDIHKFVDAYEVELVARCCRWVHTLCSAKFQAMASACSSL